MMGKRTLGLGGVSLTAPYYVYRIVFSKRDIPKLRYAHWLPGLGRSEREIWVKQRQVRDLLLLIEPDNKYT